MASLREDIAGTIVREPPPYPRYFVVAAKIIHKDLSGKSQTDSVPWTHYYS